MKDSIGSIMQFAFLVENCEKAARECAERIGVGPFFLMENVQFSELYFRGEPTEAGMNVAIGYSGDCQVEFVQALGPAPSIYTCPPYGTAPGGIHHVGVISEDLEADIERLGGAEKRLQWGETDTGMRFAYMDSGVAPGGIVELIEAGDMVHKAFSAMQRASRNWDGSDPVRGGRG